MSPNNPLPRPRRLCADPPLFWRVFAVRVVLVSRPRERDGAAHSARLASVHRQPDRRNKRDVQDRDGGIIARSSRPDPGPDAPERRIGWARHAATRTAIAAHAGIAAPINFLAAFSKRAAGLSVHLSDGTGSRSSWE
jgi:hypothetical protein